MAIYVWIHFQRLAHIRAAGLDLRTLQGHACLEFLQQEILEAGFAAGGSDLGAFGP